MVCKLLPERLFSRRFSSFKFEFAKLKYFLSNIAYEDHLLYLNMQEFMLSEANIFESFIKAIQKDQCVCSSNKCAFSMLETEGYIKSVGRTDGRSVV